MRRAAMAGLVICCTLGPAAAMAEEPSLAEAEKHLAAINALARAHYAKARDAALADGPVIVVGAETVTLTYRGMSEAAAYLPPRYHHMKALGHVALGLWSLLDPHLGSAVDGELRSGLVAYRDRLKALLPHVGALGLRWDDAKRQREILTVTGDFIESTIVAGRVGADERAAWADSIGPALLGNAYDAAEAQLIALHALVERWRIAMPPEDWAGLRVVVLGPNRPREAHPPLVYFQRRLGEAALGARLVTADNVTTTEGGLEVLAAAVNDRRLAGDFFRDSERLRRGLLSDATTRHLDKLLGP